MYEQKLIMEYDETQDVDLENNEETSDEQTDELQEMADRYAQLELEKKALEDKLKADEAIKRRLANKKSPVEKFDNETKKVVEILAKEREMRKYAEENGLTFAQAEKVYSITPNPTKETLNDTFIKAGLEALSRKERVENNTPGSKSAPTVGGKTFREMTREERIANFNKFVK